MAKGYFGARRKPFKIAKEAVQRAGTYAYRDRRRKKRDFRRLWITRINAAVRQHGMTYSKFIHEMQLKEIQLNRKTLADMAVRDPEAFAALVASLKA